MYHLAPISSRNQFPLLLTRRGLVNHAVEVGTHRGEFARVFISQWPGFLYCVDPWENLPGYTGAENLIDSDGDRKKDYEETKRVLLPYAKRSILLTGTSEECVTSFADKQLDFVYIDGDHERPHIDNDLRWWWEKIKVGGILAGHDWLMPGEINGGWGQYIQPAVEQFAKSHSVDVFMVVEENGLPWSYYMVKK